MAGPGATEAGYLMDTPDGMLTIMGTAAGAAVYIGVGATKYGAGAADEGGRQTPQFEPVQLLKMTAPFSFRWRMMRRPSSNRDANHAREEQVSIHMQDHFLILSGE